MAEHTPEQMPGEQPTATDKPEKLPLLHFFRLRFAPDLQQRLMRGATLVNGEPCEDDAPAFTRRARAHRSADRRVASHATNELLLRLERIELEPHRIHEPNEARAEPADAGDHPSFETIRRICGFISENFRGEFDAVADFDAALRDPARPQAMPRTCPVTDRLVTSRPAYPVTNLVPIPMVASPAPRTASRIPARLPTVAPNSSRR